MSKFVREVEEANPNLIPIMNLFTALIPFLLMSAVFYQMSMIQISIPVRSESGDTDIAKGLDTVTLNLQIFPDRFDLSGSSDSIQPAELAKLKRTIARKGDTPAAIAEELAQLSQAAYEIKGGYTESDTTIVVPEDEIPYQDIITAVDAVRRIRLERDGGSTSVVLFPKVVLSGRVK